MDLVIVHLSNLFIVMLFLSNNAPGEIIDAHKFYLMKFNQVNKNQKGDTSFQYR